MHSHAFLYKTDRGDKGCQLSKQMFNSECTEDAVSFLTDFRVLDALDKLSSLLILVFVFIISGQPV